MSTTETTTAAECRVIALSGKVDIRSADSLKSQILAASQQGQKLAIDLQQVTWIDMCCMQILLTAKTLDSRTRITVAPESNVAHMVTLFGLHG